jgi:hypothetical protein
MRGLTTSASVVLASALCAQMDTGLVRYRGVFDIAEWIYLHF